MNTLVNFDLLSVGIAVAATLVLGTTVYFNDHESLTNRMFLGFSLITAFWGIVNFLSYKFANPVLTLWLARGVLFFAVFQAFFLYEFFVAFPDRQRSFTRTHTYLLVPVVFATALVTLTPFAFERIVGTVVAGQVAIVKQGPGLAIFSIVAVGLVVRALMILVRKLRSSSGLVKHSLKIILIGTTVTFALIITFNLIITTVFVDPRFVPLGALFMFPFVALAAYAILREHLFNLKVIGTSWLVFLLSVASFGEIIFSDSTPLAIFRASIFLLILIIGINLIKSVIREVEQRERIQKLVEELKETNTRQESLIHFIGHEVKGFLTKAEGAFSELSDGDFGTLPETAKPLVERALTESRTGVTAVSDILRAANQKKGTIEHKKETFDLKNLVKDMVEKERPTAEGKRLVLTLDVTGTDFSYVGDAVEFGDHVLRNLIENAINYTPSGSIAVSLGHEKSKYLLAVKDTGIGIAEEDKPKLFTEGGHGAHSQEVNVHSTGYGLYIAKSVVVAHGGTIHAESEGTGKGSTFIVELPFPQA